MHVFFVQNMAIIPAVHAVLAKNLCQQEARNMN